jgi:uncharacterized protein YbjT (DUF2867 family)
MNVVIFGATGMLGQGALRECLVTAEVTQVLVIGRNTTGIQHEKLREFVVTDVRDLTPAERDLQFCDACFFCLGVSSAGMSEERYTALTHDLTLDIAQTLARLNPGMTFLYISGQGTDSSEQGRLMWARVKGRTENALLRLPFRAAYMLRPGIVVPKRGAVSRTKWTRLAYALTKPLHPVLERWFPNSVTTTDALGRVMIRLAQSGYPRSILETADINGV